MVLCKDELFLETYETVWDSEDWDSGAAQIYRAVSLFQTTPSSEHEHIIVVHIIPLPILRAVRLQKPIIA